MLPIVLRYQAANGNTAMDSHVGEHSVEHLPPNILEVYVDPIGEIPIIWLKTTTLLELLASDLKEFQLQLNIQSNKNYFLML